MQKNNIKTIPLCLLAFSLLFLYSSLAKDLVAGFSLS